MVEMNDDRINRWKCLFCGSKLKKVISLKNKTGTGDIVGYSLHCCNCGHIDNFAFDLKGIDTMIGYDNRADSRSIECGVCGKELESCNFKECHFRKEKQNKDIIEEKTSIPVEEVVPEDNSYMNTTPENVNSSEIIPVDTRISEDVTGTSERTEIHFQGDRDRTLHNVENIGPYSGYADRLLSNLNKQSAPKSNMTIPVRRGNQVPLKGGPKES